MGDRVDEQFPALQRRRQPTIDHNVDQARRVLWRAFQRGSLSEEEFASTLDRLDCDRTSHLPRPAASAEQGQADDEPRRS